MHCFFVLFLCSFCVRFVLFRFIVLPENGEINWLYCISTSATESLGSVTQQYSSVLHHRAQNRSESHEPIEMPLRSAVTHNLINREPIFWSRAVVRAAEQVRSVRDVLNLFWIAHELKIKIGSIIKELCVTCRSWRQRHQIAKPHTQPDNSNCSCTNVSVNTSQSLIPRFCGCTLEAPVRLE